MSRQTDRWTDILQWHSPRHHAVKMVSITVKCIDNVPCIEKSRKIRICVDKFCAFCFISSLHICLEDSGNFSVWKVITLTVIVAHTHTGAMWAIGLPAVLHTSSQLKIYEN